MGVMMLDGIKGKSPLSGCFFSQKAGQVGRMQIGDDRLRRKPQELFPVLLRFQKKRLRTFIQDVAWHLGGIQRAAARQSKTRRHVRPCRKDHAGWRVSHHRFREKSARPSKDLRFPSLQLHDAVIGRAQDLPVIEEKPCDVFLCFVVRPRFLVPEDHRLAALVRTRDDERRIDALRQPAVESGRRKAKSQTRHARCHGRRGLSSRRGKQDRAHRRGEHFDLFLRKHHPRLRHVDVFHHQRERLPAAVLHAAKTARRLFPVPAADELVAAHRLHQKDRALFRKTDRFCHSCLFFKPSLPRPSLQLRAAVCACDAFRMTAAVRKAFVLLLAVLAEREILHRRPLAVIGKRLDHRIARPAGGAGRVGIAIVMVLGILHICETVFADAKIRRKERCARRSAACDRTEIGQRRMGDLLHTHFRDLHRRPCRPYVLHERKESLAAPLCNDGDDAAFIPDGACDMMRPCQTANERTEAHALHTAKGGDAIGQHGRLLSEIKDSRVLWVLWGRWRLRRDPSAQVAAVLAFVISHTTFLAAQDDETGRCPKAGG